MGMHMSLLGGKGLSIFQMWSIVVNILSNQFLEKDIKDFDTFHTAILDIFSTINKALPGKHFDAPSYNKVKDLFKRWEEAKGDTKKKIFTDFMERNVNFNKVDESMIATAIVVPPAAMVAKRTGQTVPQLKLMKAIPDVVFVPSVTVLALITVKFLRTIFMGKAVSRETPPPEQPPSPAAEPPSPAVEPPPPAQPPSPAVEPPPPEKPPSPAAEPPSPEPQLPPEQPPAPAAEPPPPAQPHDHMRKGRYFCSECNTYHE